MSTFLQDWIIRRAMSAPRGNSPAPIGFSTFSVADDKKVIISPGNLQYQASTGLWRFAPHQYDTLGSGGGNNTTIDNGRSTQSDWIDLFCWGTSGWIGDNTQYHEPWRTGGASFLYPGYPNLQGQYVNGDWGWYNAIGDEPAGTWRTLMGDWDNGGEWRYLLKTRSASTVNGVLDARFAFATVAGIRGLILFPDIYTHPNNVVLPRNINNETAPASQNLYTEADWSLMESMGAAFLPACTGQKGDNDVSTLRTGKYWSALSQYYINIVADDNSSLISDITWSINSYGFAVRLVKDII